MPEVSNRPTLLRNHHRDDLRHIGKGFIMKNTTKPSQISGQVVGSTTCDPIRWKDIQKAYARRARRKAGIWAT
jgi:hypothetical protein